MSLAHKVERTQATPPITLQPIASMPRIAIPVDFRDITRRPPTALAPTAVPAPAPAAPVPRPYTDTAFELLGEVSKAFPALVQRCTQLEADLAETRDMARAEIETAGEVAREWQQIATALKMQVEGLETGFAAMKQRAEAAEQTALALRQDVEQSQHAAAEAECLSSLFQEKVIASFGVDSLLHPMLEAFRAKSLPLAD